MVLEETRVDEVYISKMNEFREPIKGRTLLDQCSESVILFSEKMLGVKLFSWQIDFANRISRAIYHDFWTNEFVALTSRQIGKSTIVAIISLWSAVFNKYPGTIHNNTIIGIISASDPQAKKLLYDIKKFIRSGDKFMFNTYKDSNGKAIFGDSFFSSLLDDDEPNNMTTITFKPYNDKIHGEYLLKGSNSGSVIKSYPPTSVVLGETFTIVIEDEAGKSDRIDDMFHYDYVYPTGNSTNAIRIYTSTPWTPSGFFYRLADPFDDYNDHPAERVMFTIDAISLESPDMRTTIQKTIDTMNSDGKTDEVQRAYYCKFVKGETVYFNPRTVFDAFSKDLVPVDSYSKECDMGVDFGGESSSRTSITISTIDEDGTILRLFNRNYPIGDKGITLIDDIKELLSRFNVQRIIPDDCPAGWHLTEKMILNGWNVKPMNYRRDKVKKYSAFRAFLNKGKIKSFIDDELKTEMLALEYSEGTKQSLIQHAPGYTDDLIDSFLMSVYFYIQEDNGFKFYDLDDVE